MNEDEINQCKVCTRKVVEPDEFCIIHAVDGSFVERVRAAMYIVNSEAKSEHGKEKKDGGKK